MKLLWIKALHLIFVVSWFAGLLYLPRLFVYHAQCLDEPSHARFLVMERKLFVLMTIAAIGAWLFGFWLFFGYGFQAYLSTFWLWAKLALVATLTGYHYYCNRILLRFRQRENIHSHIYFRWMNEIPALILCIVIVLVVVKPF